jgi:ferric-dicitrate binding protein FerR (iron transport regulator)
VRVLGTKFDVSAYPEDKDINVVLESGSVEILQAKNQSVIQKLKPGEKAQFDTERRDLSVSTVDCHDYTSWKDGILVFANEPMENVIKKLKRWYNIDIEVKNPKVNKLIFNATIVNESVEDIFDLMKFSCSISYTIISSRNPEIPVKVIIY